MKGKKIISYGLWGKNPKYTIGAIRNAELALNVYDGWICRVYCGKTVPEEILYQLSTFPNVEVIMKEEPENFTAMFWRFHSVSDPDVEIVLSRDLDSRLNLRERAAVDEWMNTGKDFHIIRDHPCHSRTIIGGGFAMRTKNLREMTQWINAFDQKDMYGTDEDFLEQVVYPKVKDSCVIHDSRSLKVKNPNGGFVVQGFNEYDMPIHSVLPKLPSFMIVFTLGLEEMKACNGLIRELCKSITNHMILMCPTKYLSSVQSMFKDMKRVTVIGGDKNEKKKLIDGFGGNVPIYQIGNGEVNDSLDDGMLKEIYRRFNVEYKKRWTSFRVGEETLSIQKPMSKTANYSCEFGGGVGNHLFQISNILARAWREGKSPVFFLQWNRNTSVKTKNQGNHPKTYLDSLYRKLKFVDSNSGIILIRGAFQGYHYFEGYDSRIRDMFSPPPDFISAMETKYPQLKQKNTVSVHIRRGDYLAVDYVNHIDYTQYVPNALKRIPMVSTVFVFTDDKQWVKDKLHLPNMVSVDEDVDYKELWLMSLCHHNIIANSTFSWWGAFLNRHPTKVVCYPSRWYNTARMRDRDIVIPGWIRVPCN